MEKSTLVSPGDTKAFFFPKEGKMHLIASRFAHYIVT